MSVWHHLVSGLVQNHKVTFSQPLQEDILRVILDSTDSNSSHFTVTTHCRINTYVLFFLMKTFLSVGEWIFKHLVICQLTSVLFCLGNQIHPSVICINLPVFILNLPGSIISKFWYLHKYNVTLLFHLLPDFNLRWLCQHFWQSNLYSLFCFFDFV